MLWFIFVVLLVLWLLGMIGPYTVGCVASPASRTCPDRADYSARDWTH
jgi:hypothetical protein